MRKGVTIIELMVAMIVMSLIMTALWRVYSGTQRSAKEIILNHTINDDVDRTLLKITDDLREANFVEDNFPVAVAPNLVAGLKTEDAKNQLKFTKILYDFKKDPMDLPTGEVNYTQNCIRYYVEKEDDSKPDSLWVLNREMIPIDNKKVKIKSQMTVFTMLNGIKECIFYRIVDPDSSRSGNVYIKLKMARNADGPDESKYANDITISVKERGANPE